MKEGYLVVFVSQRKTEDLGYEAMAQRLEQEVRSIPGFLRLESVRDESGKGITLSYWENLEGIRLWKEYGLHRQAKSQASQWYTQSQVEIYEVRSWNPR